MVFAALPINDLSVVPQINMRITENKRIIPLLYVLGCTYGSPVITIRSGSRVDKLVPHPLSVPDHMVLVMRGLPSTTIN